MEEINLHRPQVVQERPFPSTCGWSSEVHHEPSDSELLLVTMRLNMFVSPAAVCALRVMTSYTVCPLLQRAALITEPALGSSV